MHDYADYMAGIYYICLIFRFAVAQSRSMNDKKNYYIN